MINDQRLVAPATTVGATPMGRAGRSATHTGTSSRRIAPRLATVFIAAVCTRAHAALAAGFGVASSRLCISVKRPGFCPGAVIGSAAAFVSAAACSVYTSASAIRSAAVEIAPVVKRITPRVIAAVVKQYGAVVPVKSPMRITPSKPSEPTNSEPGSERKIGTAKPNSGIWQQARPYRDGISVHQPRVDRKSV